MTSDRLGLQSSSQRRGVMPFVLFWNFSGHISLKSLKLPTQQERQMSVRRETSTGGYKT